MSGRLNITNPTLPIWFFVSYALYVLVQYPVSAAFPTTFACYGVLLPAFGVYAYKHKAAMLALLKTPVAGLFAGFFVFIIFHAPLLTPGYSGISKTIGDTLATSMFFLSSLVFFTHADAKLLRRFLIVLSSLAGICAIISIYLHLIQTIEPRLVPIGRASHPILGALVYGVAGIISLYLLATTKSLAQKAGYLLVMLVIGYMIYLTQSRMPLFAYALSVALGSVLFAKSPVKILMLGVGVLLLAGAAVMVAPKLEGIVQQMLSMWLERGDSFRLALWQQTIEKIVAQPWVGYGMQAQLDQLPNTPEVYSPHNIYLATAFYAGVPAAFLFVTALAMAAWGAVKHCRASKLAALSLLLMVHGGLAAMVDFGQPVKSANPLWIIFWMPVVIMIVSATRKRNTKLASTIRLQSQEGQVDVHDEAFQPVR